MMSDEEIIVKKWAFVIIFFLVVVFGVIAVYEIRTTGDEYPVKVKELYQDNIRLDNPTDSVNMVQVNVSGHQCVDDVVEDNQVAILECNHNVSVGETAKVQIQTDGKTYSYFSDVQFYPYMDSQIENFCIENKYTVGFWVDQDHFKCVAAVRNTTNGDIDFQKRQIFEKEVLTNYSY